MSERIDADDLRQRVRSERHATSYPLVAVGAIGFHYVSSEFVGWIPLVYGLPLAFVIVWALQWRTERLDGVGSGHDDTLMIAFAVFLGTSLVGSQNWFAFTDSFGEWLYPAMYLLPPVAGLAAMSYRQRNPRLGAWAGFLLAALAVCAASRDVGFGWGDSYLNANIVVLQVAFLVAAIAGGRRYHVESSANM
jgi:hypothetical protein